LPVDPSAARGPGAVTREMVQARTRGLALIAGRSVLQISQADYEQARRELTGESDMGRQEARLDAGSEKPPAP
jgi:hypothetical protein